MLTQHDTQIPLSPLDAGQASSVYGARSLSTGKLKAQKTSVPLRAGLEQKGSLPRQAAGDEPQTGAGQRKFFNKAIPAGGAEPGANSGSMGEPGGNPIPRLSPALGVQRSLVAASSSLPRPHASWFWDSGEWALVGTLLLSVRRQPTHSEPRARFREGDMF